MTSVPTNGQEAKGALKRAFVNDLLLTNIAN